MLQNRMGQRAGGENISEWAVPQLEYGVSSLTLQSNASYTYLSINRNAALISTHIHMAPLTHAYISSYSSSPSSNTSFFGASFFFQIVFRSSGHVGCSFNQGSMHSLSNR